MNLYPVQQEGKYGYVNIDTRRFAIEPQFERTFKFHEGIGKIKENKKFGFINEKGKYIIRPYYEDAGNYSEGLVNVKINNKYGYFDKQGELVIEPRFEFAHVFSEGMAHVKINNKWGYINKQGEIVIKPKYEIAEAFKEGLAVIGVTALFGDKKFGYINQDGKMVISPRFYLAESFSGGLALINTGLWGFINKKGKIVIKPQFNAAESFSEGLAVIGIKTKAKNHWHYGFIDEKGKIRIKQRFTFASSFYNGLALVKIGKIPPYLDQYSYEYIIMNKIKLENERQLIISAYQFNPERNRYEMIDSVHFNQKVEICEILKSCGYTITKSKYGYINQSGQIVIDAQYDYAENFDAGVANVRIDRKNGAINLKGEYIIYPV